MILQVKVKFHVEAGGGLIPVLRKLIGYFQFTFKCIERYSEND